MMKSLNQSAGAKQSLPEGATQISGEDDKGERNDREQDESEGRLSVCPLKRHRFTFILAPQCALFSGRLDQFGK